MAKYERLSALDASFLQLEDENCHMHVGGVLIFDAGPVRADNGGIDIARIRRAIHARLHLVPRLRQRLAYIPYEHLPIWVDDDRFHLAYHVRHTSIPRPGDDRALKRLVGQLMSEPLDRSRPLWEMWIVEGLRGDRFALVSKSHHCMIDGISAAEIMSVILQSSSTTDIEAPRPWVPRPHPGEARLIFDQLQRRATQASAAWEAMQAAVGDPAKALRKLGQSAAGILEAVAPALSPASDTPINVKVGRHRRFDWAAMRVSDLRTVTGILGGTLNDVVLAITSGALRRFFEERKLNPDDLEIRAMVPVTVRTDKERGRLGNRMTEIVVPLPVKQADPVERLRTVQATMADLKKSRHAVGAQVLTAVSEWAIPNLLVQAMRLASRTGACNLVVTNIPGPQIPLYLNGALMQATYPVVPLFENMGIAVGLFSYNGGLFWGINGDWEQMTDLHDFVRAIESSFRDIQQAAALAGRQAAATRHRRSRLRPAAQARSIRAV